MQSWTPAPGPGTAVVDGPAPVRWRERFNDRGYRCWLKVGAALRELVAGVAPFVDRVARAHHAALLDATRDARRRATAAEAGGSGGEEEAVLQRGGGRGEVEMAAAVAEVGGPSHLQQLSLHRGHP